MGEEDWETIGFIVISKVRRCVLKQLYVNGPSIPKDLAIGCDLPINHISNTLKQLSDKKLIFCINENNKKGRIYKLTEFGNKCYIQVDKLIHN